MMVVIDGREGGMYGDNSIESRVEKSVVIVLVMIHETQRKCDG